MQEAGHNAERVRQAESLAQQAQLRALRYQLNPHFLFNALNATSTLVRDGNTSAATELIARLGGYLRTTLSEIDEAEAPLSREMEMAREYLEIERTRFGDRLSIHFDVDPATLRAYVPSLLLQPVIENAVRYGVAASLEGGAVRISARREGMNLRIEVANSDSGTRFAEPPKGFGIGLANTQLRLEALYGPKQSVECQQKEDGFVVVLLLPFHEKPAGLP
jgi:LytS/YehU family sensor histidine kinase